MVQLMPLPLTVSCSSKIHVGFTFLVPAHPGRPRQRAVKRVCVCVYWFTEVVPDKGSLNRCVCVWVGVCPFDPDWIHYKNVCVCVCACSTYYASSVNNSLILITYSVTLSISGGHSSAGGHDADGGTRHWRVAAATAGATQRSGASICTCRP